MKRRIALCILGIFFITSGITLSIKADLGISALSIIPFVVSKIMSINMGYCNFLFFAILIAIQALILRKRFTLAHILQLPFGMLFSFFIQMTQALYTFEIGDQYLVRCIVLAFSLLLSAVGIYLYTLANVVMNAPEGLTKCIADTYKLPFHNVKIGLDCLFVCIAAMLSFLVLHEFIGIREGTIISALLVGKFIALLPKTWKAHMVKFCYQSIE